MDMSARPAWQDDRGPPDPDASRDGPARRRWRRSVAIWAAAVVLSVGSLLLRPDPVGQSPEASAFSLSAIGHHAFVAWLEAMGAEVVVERARIGREAAPDTAILMLAPDGCHDWVDDETTCHRFSHGLRRALDRGAAVVLALPRWLGEPDPERPARARSVASEPSGAAAEVLARAVLAATTDLLPREIEAWLLSDDDPELDALLGSVSRRDDVVIARSEDAEWRLGLASTQVIAAPDTAALMPLAVAWSEGDDAGALVAQVAGTRLYIISDPTIFANGALADADHAELLATTLWSWVGARRLVIDETIHIHRAAPSLWREVFQMPLLPVALHLLILFGFALWSAAGRPRPRARDAGVEGGSEALIETTAAIAEEGATSPLTLVRYWEATVHDIARKLGLHSSGDTPAALDALDRWLKGATRPIDAHALDARVRALGALGRSRRQAARIIATAQEIHTLRKEMLDGR
jgi:hypothetical protein